jgi:GMP synthase (glutamine-hydrolysing)
MVNKDTILILDLGSQYTQLIARRIRENNVYSEIHPYSYSTENIKKLNPKGIILSGGPLSVYDEGSPLIDKELFALGIPVLGICYGLHLIGHLLGGEVQHADHREYGKSIFKATRPEGLLKGMDKESIVWMSHGDSVTKMPKGFELYGVSDNSPYCAIADIDKNIYGIQFHPEVAHTRQGSIVIRNFLFDICKCKGDWTPKNLVASSIEEIKKKTAGKTVLCAMSGGVDSAVAAVLAHKAIGDNLISIHVDTGMMRKDESRYVVDLFRKNFNLKLVHIDASEKFLTRLAGISDPERKRKIIGETFIEVFEEEAKKHKDAEFLVQGTLYPDVIESVAVKGSSVTIKTHHNVGGLPEKMNLKLIEPFRELFKDEVRNVGRELEIPEEFIMRHPFPGPGLAVRVLGEITKERLDILREADDIFISEIKNDGLYGKIWQAFAVLLPVQTVGVMGDARTYENAVALRAVVSTDGMTADWYYFEKDFLERVSNKIINSVRGINRVVLDISSKPPATIEWE